MFGAELWNLYAHITFVYHILTHSFHLIAENNSIFHASFRNKIAEHHTVLHLLYGTKTETVFFQCPDSRKCVFVKFPTDSNLCNQRRLVYFLIGRAGSDTAQDYLLHPESI